MLIDYVQGGGRDFIVDRDIATDELFDIDECRKHMREGQVVREGEVGKTQFPHMRSKAVIAAEVAPVQINKIMSLGAVSRLSRCTEAENRLARDDRNLREVRQKIEQRGREIGWGHGYGPHEGPEMGRGPEEAA